MDAGRTDIAAQIGAVTRAVESRLREGRPSRVVVASRTYPTTVEDLWDAITSVERIPRWFLPIHGDLRLGGRYQLEGNAGGVIIRCEPPRHLAVTWEYGGEVSWVEVRLEELEERAGGGTRLELRHEAHVDDHWEQFGPGAAGVGWELGLFGLGQYLSGDASVDRAEAEAWMVSEEGKSFMRRSSDAWGEASIASGTVEAEARAAAGRTTAFYTGESEPAPE
jgi:uncharacterized protein YndB with AHSA1/START domain